MPLAEIAVNLAFLTVTTRVLFAQANPGSDYSSGVLRGAVIDIAQDGSCLDYLLTTG